MRSGLNHRTRRREADREERQLRRFGPDVCYRCAQAGESTEATHGLLCGNHFRKAFR